MTVLRDELYEIGLAQRHAMFGPAAAEDQVEHTTDLNDKLQEYVTRTCFGDIWQREGLSLDLRSMITVAMLIASAKPHEIRVHLNGALANGVTPLQLREIVVHSILYCGIPSAVEGMRALEEVLTARGIAFSLDGEAERAEGVAR